MPTKLQEPGNEESLAAKKVKEIVLRHVRQEKLSTEEMASRLGLLPLGVEFLLGQEWSLETGWRVAESLGLRIGIIVE